MIPRAVDLGAVCWLAVLVPFASGQSGARELHWSRLEVTARLDGDGRLEVHERQAMVFTGDWNGGERRFRVRWDQKLEFLGIDREDESSHTRVPLARGDLSQVDHYDFTDSSTLRWRSRLPDDPPFDRREIVYVLRYRLSNILVPEGGDRYRLDHDFAFPDRDGAIEAFSLQLSLDPVWQPPPDFDGHWTRGRLLPGENFVVNVPLSFRGEGSPSGVRQLAAPGVRSAISAAFLVGLVAIAIVFYVQEDHLGRFAPLTDPETIDEAWLRENVLSLLPEEVGAAWDDTTAAPEVAAVLARMVAEGKIASEVYVSQGFFSSAKHLRLKLLTEKSKLSGYERSLVNALFFSGKESDTESIRAHYRSRGFDPASKIAGPLKRKVGVLLRTHPHRDISKTPTSILLGLSLLSMLVVLLIEPPELLRLLPVLGPSFLFYLMTLIPAFFYRKRVEHLAPFSLTFLVPIAVLAASGFFFVYGNPSGLGVPALLALVFFLLALFSSLFNAAKFRDGITALETRKKLAAARRYFRNELRRREPRLRDEWFPYFLAFGLGSDVDRWFRAFGGSVSSSTSFGSGSVSTHSTGPTSWTGGGGAFGGAGATGSWAAAVGSVAAGVAAPSSGGSGGGGGGGGGGSSGGGGGGGW